MEECQNDLCAVVSLLVMQEEIVSKVIKIVLKVINTLIVLVVVLAAVALVGVRFFGIRLYTVLSGSMEPEYPTGSLIYVKETDPASLEEGDVITFMLSESTTATHRIVEVIPDEPSPGEISFRTKGDANDFEDAGLVDGRNVIGVPILTIPELGYTVSKIQTPPGSYGAFAIGGALILFVFITDSLVSDKKEKKEDKKKKEDSEEE